LSNPAKQTTANPFKPRGVGRLRGDRVPRPTGDPDRAETTNTGAESAKDPSKRIAFPRLARSRRESWERGRLSYLKRLSATDI